MTDVTRADFEAILKLAKAASERGKMDEVRQILDLWDSTVQTLSSREVKMGPEEESSGKGASKMIRDYSDLAPQSGIEKLYEELAHMLEEQRAVKAALEALVKKAEDEEKKEEEKKEEKEEKAAKAEKEEREEKNPGDFGEEYKDSERAAKAFASALVKELSALLKGGEPEGFEKKERVEERNSNQAARPQSEKANPNHGPDGKFDAKLGKEGEEEKKEDEAEKGELAELRSLVKGLVGQVNALMSGRQPSAGSEVAAPLLGRATTPIDVARIDGLGGSAIFDRVLSKASQDFEKGLLPEAVKAEIDSLLFLQRNVEGGVAPRQAFEQALSLASPLAREYFQ